MNRRLAERRNIVLLVVDGCGLAFVQRRGPESLMARYLQGALTSVFPSTTATAVTTFMTGLPPSRHALTGWHMYFEELDDILACLPLTPREAREKPLDAGNLPSRLFGHDSVFAGMGRRCYAVSPRAIVDSPFNRYHTRGAETAAYGSVAEMFDQLAAIVTGGSAPAYVYAYYAELDSLAHHYGTDSAQTRACFAALDSALSGFVRTIRGTDTSLVITADHGFIDSPPNRVIELDRHPKLAAMLARPLCGERRVAYCYVREERREEFEAYVARHLDRALRLLPSAQLVNEGWFGPGDPDPRLARRIGDYALVMKGDWTIKDWLPGEKRYRMIGVHGGTSAEEMLVPLVLIEA